MAWSRGKGGAMLYANGHAWPTSPALARSLCSQRSLLPPDKLTPTEQTLLLALVNDGHLVLHKPRHR
jgi:50S ribosomal protein L16 3-hydroxylase